MDLLIGPGWVDCRIGRGLTLDWEIGQRLVVKDWAKIEIASADRSRICRVVKRIGISLSFN